MDSQHVYGNMFAFDAGPSSLQPPVPSSLDAFLAPADGAPEPPRPAPPALEGGRPPRSRKNRPCDLCRRSKSRCTIGPAGPPCTQCAETHRTCTFNYAPPPRKIKSPEDEAQSAVPAKRPREMSDTADSGTRAPSTAAAGPDESAASPSVSGLDVLAAAVPSFDQFANSDFDPHDDLLPISDPAAEPNADGTHVKQISSDPTRPIFVVMHPKAEALPNPSTGATALSHLRVFMRSHPLHPTEAQLLATYNTHIHPALPILPNDKTYAPQLLAAILASACSHTAELRPLAAPAVSLYGTASLGQAENSLAGVAAAVLELGMRPVASSRSAYLLLAKTIALAQLLGMHMSPIQWAIPKWERDLRLRLWWALAWHDAWMSFLNSRPCHIQSSNSSVPLPTIASVTAATAATTGLGPAGVASARAFVASCRLVQAVCRLQAETCTLSAVSHRPADERKEEVESIAEIVDELFAEWQDMVLATTPRPTGVCSFLIHLLGFRCMLRRLIVELEYGLGSTFTPSADVLAPFHDCVNFISRLSTDELDGYYLQYASHILSSVTSSLIRLTLASEDSLNKATLRLLATLVDSLRRYHTASAWDIAVPALRRAAAVAARFTSGDEHAELCNALRGSFQASPMTQLANTGLALPPVPQDTPGDQQFLWSLSATDWDFNDIFSFPV